MYIPSQIEYMLCKLADNGYEAYLVGGCVRDFLLGKTPDDYDITTSATPEETMAVFEGDRVIPTGLKHGTVTVIYDGVFAEITTYRTETTYTDGRHPDKVEFSKNIKDDLCRRDFTVNAMAMNSFGEVLDLYGGKSDLENGIIRAVGNPTERFTEDALRIMRAFRFASKLGFDIEKDTLNAAFALAPRLSLVSRERIFVEFEKLLCGSSAGNILKLMVQGNVFDFVFDSPDINTEALDYIDDLPRRADIRLAAMLMHDENIAVQVASLKTSAAFAENVKSIASAELPEKYDNPTLRKFIFESGKQAALDRALINRNNELHDKLVSLIEKENCFCIADLDISGNDISAATSLRGREIGEALHRLLYAVFDEKVTNQKANLTEYLKKVDKA